MQQYQQQIQRIKTKLGNAKKLDNTFIVFGSSSHRYILADPVSEQEVNQFELKYNITLPDCYKAFVTQIGSGGVGTNNSGAGPYYGIYRFGDNIEGQSEDHPYHYLTQQVVINPEMTKEYWLQQCGDLVGEDDIPDEEFNRLIDHIYAGLLPLGTHGCTFYQSLVLNGVNKGRVVYNNMDFYMPFFCYEANFLDWYERWLDEILSGQLMKNRFSFFGTTKAVSESPLPAQKTGWKKWFKSIFDR